MFFEFCLRIYACMSLGQIFSKHRILCSVIAYILIGIIVTVIFFKAADIGNGMVFDSDSVGRVAATMGLFDLILLIIDAILYFPTSFLIGKRLNLT